MSLQKIVDVREVAEYLKITEETVYKLAQSGKIPATKIGNQWRFDLAEIKKLFKHNFPNPDGEENGEGDSENNE